MKTKFLIAVAVFVFTGMTAFAQVDKTERMDDNMSGKQRIEQNRKEMIANVMRLEGEESEEFWPVYEEYRSEMGKLQDQEMDLMNEYSQTYGHLTNEQADEMLKNMLEIDKEKAKVKKNYRSKFEKVLPPTKVARFYQADNRIDLAMEYEAAKRIPIVDIDDENNMNEMEDEYRRYENERQYEYEDQ